MRLNDISFKTKIFFAFGGGGVLLGIMLVVGYLTISTVRGSLDEMYNEHYTASVGVTELKADLNQVRALLMGMIAESEPSKRENLRSKINETSLNVDKRLDALLENIKEPTMVKKLEEIKDVWTAFRDTRDKEIIPAIFAGDLHKAVSIATGIQAERYKKFNGIVTELVKKEDEEAAGAYKRADNSYNKAVFFFIAALTAGSVFGIIVIYNLSKNIITRLKILTDEAELIANGDFTNITSVSGKDEIGKLAQSINSIVENISGIISSIKEDERHLKASSEEMLATAKNIAAGTMEQAQKADQVSTASEEMSATVTEVARDASNAAEAAVIANDSAQNGGEVVLKTIEGMNAVAKMVKESSIVIRELGSRSNEIGRIIKVIDDIADQTNLLALNAAIEAARAGEQGRGFAVVADEVRKLAERTTKATKEIGEMIKEIQGETHKAVLSMDAGTKEVEAEVQLATDAGNSLKDIISQVDKVTGIIQHIATATEEQSKASEEISRDIETVAEVAKEMANGAGRIVDVAGKLKTIEADIDALIANFKIKEEKEAAGKGLPLQAVSRGRGAMPDEKSAKKRLASRNI
ncbi:MAG: methyl-accepting chemotaxis protein [Deltaproteobacteria bacterium]|nr:methyl-accepting chemotaxis protein [Deltaproteobacteria bacterium]